MDRKQTLDKFREIIDSTKISKYEELVDFLNKGLGDIIYEDLKKTDHEFLNILHGFGTQYPRETLYVFQQFYNYITEKELANSEHIELGILYFWMGNLLYLSGKKGYGKHYLKAYLEDIGFHDNYIGDGAIQALKVYCYLGQKGIESLDRTLMQSTRTSKEELKNYIKKCTRSEFERLIVEIENKFSLEGNEYFFLPSAALKEIVIKIEPQIKKKGNKTSAKLLEYLCQLLFGSVVGFRYKIDERSALLQLDGMISNNSDHPFLKELGNTIIVEAKQYFNESRVDRNKIDVLAMNMARLNASSAFLITTAQLSKPAEKEIYHNYLREGSFIIHFSFQDIRDLCYERVSFPVLISSKVANIKTNRRL